MVNIMSANHKQNKETNKATGTAASILIPLFRCYVSARLTFIHIIFLVFKYILLTCIRM